MEGTTFSLLNQGLSEMNNPRDQLNNEILATEFPGLFSSIVWKAKCVPYDIELVDNVPVRSPLPMCPT